MGSVNLGRGKWYIWPGDDDDHNNGLLYCDCPLDFRITKCLF